MCPYVCYYMNFSYISQWIFIKFGFPEAMKFRKNLEEIFFLVLSLYANRSVIIWFFKILVWLNGLSKFLKLWLFAINLSNYILTLKKID